MTELGLELCIFCTTICCLLTAGLINLTFLTCYIFLIQLPSLFCRPAELMDWMGMNTSLVIVKGEIFDGFMQLRVIFYGARVYNLYWLRTELMTLQFCGGISGGIILGGETTRCSFAQLLICVGYLLQQAALETTCSTASLAFCEYLLSQSCQLIFYLLISCLPRLSVQILSRSLDKLMPLLRFQGWGMPLPNRTMYFLPSSQSFSVGLVFCWYSVAKRMGSLLIQRC